MIFIICIVIGILGIVITLWIAQKPQSIVFPEKKSWIMIHPEVWESHMSSYVIESSREFLKEILLMMIYLYRSVSKKILIKKMIKQQIRKFLSTTSPKHPNKSSLFWEEVKDIKKISENH